ncbi:MAG: hypothetical protein U0V56_11470 [Actinomycetota bacterium]
MDAFTASVELAVGLACVVLAVARTRPTAAVRGAGALIAVAGLVAVVHAASALL